MNRRAVILLLALAVASPALAGGPALLWRSGQPYVWPDGGAAIPYNPDRGPLGTIPADEMLAYANALVRSTRPDAEETPGFVRENLKWGAGPRAGQYLVLGAKTRAVIRGRFHVSFEDIQRVARPVLRHRILTNYSAQAEGIRPDDIIDRLLETVPVHPSRTPSDGGLPEVVRTNEG